MNRAPSIPAGKRCRASHFSVTRVPARDEMVVVTQRGRNIATLVPAEVWAARQHRPTEGSGSTTFAGEPLLKFIVPMLQPHV